jgi:peptide/nickel transport system permease protein
MSNYIIRRIFLMIPTLFFVTAMVFLVVRLLPGDVVENIIGQYTPLTQGNREAVRHDLGLDRPWFSQYFDFVGGVFKGDLGTSLQSQRPITEALRNRLPVSAELGLLSIFIGLVWAIPIGVLAAIRQDSLLDHVARSAAISFIAMPSFWLGTLVIVLPNVWWKWAPPIQYRSFLDDPRQNLYLLIFPAAILGLTISGGVMRLTRAQMLEILRQDYIRTAWSKGLKERTIVVRHALKNALIPVITLVALQIPVVVGGTVVLETIFSVPGMGRYLVEAANASDYTVIQAVNLIVALIVVFANLAVDVMYGYLDPRIRYA